MRTWMLVLGLLLSGSKGAAAEDPEPGSAPVVGEAYPALRLPTIDGKQTLDLRQLRGKKLLLIEFASW